MLKLSIILHKNSISWPKKIALCTLVMLNNAFGYSFTQKDLLSMDSGQEEYMGKRRFLYGESMGGAVSLLIHKKDPAFWHGAVLVAPMCKVVRM